jgi:hypothetical protein|tara:strand:+ start:1782 stop:2393 length:612 start_codon:yes stop_codon:yes gene_type:complete
MAQERLAQLLQVLAGMQAENPPLPPSPDLTGQMGEPAPRLPMGTGVTAGMTPWLWNKVLSGENTFRAMGGAEPRYGLPTGRRDVDIQRTQYGSPGDRGTIQIPANRPTFSPELEAANARLRQSGTEITPQFLAMQTRGPLVNYMETIRQLDEASAPARMEIADLEAKKLAIEEQIKEATRLMKDQQKEGTVQLKGSQGMGLGR